jgi:hypothetical protein
MSFLPYRDNPDLAGVGEITQAVLEKLSERIDESSSRGLHADQCSQSCGKGEACQYWRHHMASSEETLGWLVGQGLLDSNAVVQWLAGQS